LFLIWAYRTARVGAPLSDELVEALPRDDALSIGIGVRGWPKWPGERSRRCPLRNS